MNMSAGLTLLRIIGAIAVGLGASILGGFVGFLSDIGPNEGPFERVLLMSFYYFLGGIYIGYFLPRVWYLSLAVAWMALVSIPQSVINFFTSSEGVARWIMLNVSVTSPLVALLAGYLGYRLYVHFHQLPAHKPKVAFRYALGILISILVLYFIASPFIVDYESGGVRVGDTPYIMSEPTDLHYAAEKGDLEEIVQQIKLGADVNASDMAGRTPLHFAVGTEQTAAVELLLSFNASPDIQDREYGVTPLHWAVGSGNLDIVKLLAPMMDNIDAKNRYGQTAAMIAAADDKQEILDVLTTHGAKTNSEKGGGEM